MKEHVERLITKGTEAVKKPLVRRALAAEYMKGVKQGTPEFEGRKAYAQAYELEAGNLENYSLRSNRLPIVQLTPEEEAFHEKLSQRKSQDPE